VVLVCFVYFLMGADQRTERSDLPIQLHFPLEQSVLIEPQLSSSLTYVFEHTEPVARAPRHHLQPPIEEGQSLSSFGDPTTGHWND